MPPASEEALFLISCVRNTGDGKPNWKAVCEERGITSAQAASKRWYRLCNANPVGAAAKSSELETAKEAPAKVAKEKAPKGDKVPKVKKPPKEKKAGAASPRKKRKTGKETEIEVEEPRQSTTSTVKGEDEPMMETAEMNGTGATEGSSD